ncbi:FtsQ-type POTRA domain-containing protein [Patescibacteria group bacterium]|nr:FtsQ-type POTRA domain-containing protein [Patescibacteria group bacterium]
MRRYKKSYRTRKKRSVFAIFKKKFFWLGLLFLIILSGLTYLFIFSSVFQIKNIAVLGTEKTSAEEIRTIISNNAKNIFLADLEEIDRMLLEKYPQIADIDIKRDLPDVLLVQIEERKPVAVISKYEGYFFIDKEAVIFEEIPEKPLEMLIIKSEKDLIQKEQLNQVLKINSALKNDLKLFIKEILIVSEKRIDVETMEGWNIYFNSKKDLDWQLEQFSILLKEKISLENRKNLEYVDLRFEKIYIYPENY